MTLFPLINQENNLHHLKQIIKNERIGSAYLFYGPEGCGMEGFAMEMASMLNCQDRENSPCGNCPACHKMKTLEHGNLTLVYPLPKKKKESQADADPFRHMSTADMEELQRQIQQKSQNPYMKIALPSAQYIHINFIREIKRKTYLTRQEEGWKVIIIFDAQRMTQPAANAFLKILEEPPPRSVFILTSSNISTIFPTIISRCQKIFFPALSQESLTRYLVKQGIPEDQTDLIINLSNHDVTKALQLKGANLQALKKVTLNILRSIASWNIQKVLKNVDKLVTLSRTEPDQFKQILLSLAFWFRDALILKSGLDEQRIIQHHLRDEIQKFTEAYPDFDGYLARSSVENCIDFINRNVYINLALLNMFYQLRNALKSEKKSV